MILCIDIGNTNIVLGCYDGERLVFESRVDTNSARMADQYSIMIKDIFRLYEIDRHAMEGTIISSVVPPVTPQIVQAAEKVTGKRPLLIGPGLKTGLNIKIDDPTTLGSDIACAAIAAKNKYPTSCIVIDLGTANKVIAVDKTGSLVGCVISPGVGLSFSCLAKGTAALPLLGIDRVEHVIGTNTGDSVRAGILVGTAAMLDGIIQRMEEEIGPCHVVATGGFAEAVHPYCRRVFEINHTLVLEGLRTVYERNARGKRD